MLFVHFQGGFYLLNLVDNFAGGFPLIIVGVGELIAIQWVYGFNQFSNDTEIMMGKKPNLFFKIALVFIAPALMIVSISAITHTANFTVVFQNYRMGGFCSKPPYLMKNYNGIFANVPIMYQLSKTTNIYTIQKCSGLYWT